MKFSISYPVKPLHFNQHFGENAVFYSDPKYGGVKGHNGIDFQAYHGQPIYASHDGDAYYEFDGAQGEGVVLRTHDMYDYEGGQVYFKTIYWHMADPIKEPKFASLVWKAVGYKPDQTGLSNTFIPIKRGDLIGYADNTGASSGDHLHFGVKPVAIGEANGAFYNLEQNNGYNGAIDPAPFFDGSFAQDSITVIPTDQAEAIIQNIMSSDSTPQQKSSWLTIVSNWLKSIFP